MYSSNNHYKLCLSCFVCLLFFLFVSFISCGIAKSETIQGPAYGKDLKYFEFLKKEKKYIQAEKVISRAISEHQNIALLYLLRGKLRHYFMNNMPGAILDYSMTINLDGKSFPTTYFKRGSCLYSLGQYRQSISDYSKALKLTPNNHKVYLMRAKSFAKLGMVPNALEDIKILINKRPEYRKQALALMDKILSGDKNF